MQDVDDDHPPMDTGDTCIISDLILNDRKLNTQVKDDGSLISMSGLQNVLGYSEFIQAIYEQPQDTLLEKVKGNTYNYDMFYQNGRLDSVHRYAYDSDRKEYLERKTKYFYDGERLEYLRHGLRFYQGVPQILKYTLYEYNNEGQIQTIDDYKHQARNIVYKKDENPLYSLGLPLEGTPHIDLLFSQKNQVQSFDLYRDNKNPIEVNLSWASDNNVVSILATASTNSYRLEIILDCK